MLYPILSNADVSYCVESAPSEPMTRVIDVSHKVSQIVRQAFGGQAFGGGGLCLVTSTILVDILNQHDHVDAQLFQGEARAFNRAYSELAERSRRGEIRDIKDASRAERREIQRLVSKAKIVEVHANAFPDGHKQPDVKAPLMGHVAVFVTTKTGERFLIDPTAYQFNRSGEQKLPFGRILVVQLREHDTFETLHSGYHVFPTSRNQQIASHIVYRYVPLDALATLDPKGDNDLNPKRYSDLYAAALDALI